MYCRKEKSMHYSEEKGQIVVKRRKNVQQKSERMYCRNEKVFIVEEGYILEKRKNVLQKIERMHYRKEKICIVGKRNL